MSLRNKRLKACPCRFSEVLLLSAVLLALYVSAHAQTVDLSGQASGWVTVKRDDTQIGVRYIPDLLLRKHLSETFEISAEAEVNAQWFSQFDGSDYGKSTSKASPYRLWVRFASAQYEVRAGLQKISFGSATLLRPLMWFDSIDPSDPLQFTNGVYGLLGRYYFLNNANIWVWALHINDDLKGWETLPTHKRGIERGGRIQVPVQAGEMGFSYHRRMVNPEGFMFGAAYPMQGTFPEDRFGLDGKWDIGVGVWFEGTVTRRGFDTPGPRYLHLLTVGTDYTLDLGNGPHLLFEQFVRDEAEYVFGTGKGDWLSALSIDYPISLLDKVTLIVYYNWDSDEWLHLLQWRRTYDQWQVHVSAFWNPDRTTFTQDAAMISSSEGKGVQLMLEFNH